MHRTLKAETIRPAAATFLQQQERFDRFVHEFNTERPHEALLTAAGSANETRAALHVAVAWGHCAAAQAEDLCPASRQALH